MVKVIYLQACSSTCLHFTTRVNRNTKTQRSMQLSSYCFFPKIAYMTQWANWFQTPSQSFVWKGCFPFFPFTNIVSNGNSVLTCNNCPWINFLHRQESWSLRSIESSTRKMKNHAFKDNFSSTNTLIWSLQIARFLELSTFGGWGF